MISVTITVYVNEDDTDKALRKLRRTLSQYDWRLRKVTTNHKEQP